VTSVVGDRIYPLRAPQLSPDGYIIVTQVQEFDPQLLASASEYPQTRIQVECITVNARDVIPLGEKVKKALQNITNQAVGSWTATVHKIGVDFTDYSDDRQVCRRVMEFAVRWR
jgi:predicted RNA-binding protein Jag